MNNHKSAKGFVQDAQLIHEEAEESFKKNHYHRVVRKCQESCELAIKGLFKEMGIDYPKSHRLGPVILKELKNKSGVTNEEVDRLHVYSDSLALEREVSFYGDEEGTPADELFEKDDAQEALAKAKWVLEFVERFVH